MKKGFLSFFVVIILFLLGCILFYKQLMSTGFGVFNLLTSGRESELISTRSGELLMGDKVFGRFHSLYPDLSIISVRFTNQNRDSKDTLVFRIKAVGAEKWYYQASYNTDQFQPGMLFPFGFPALTDSANQNYEFQLESLHGATSSGIFLDHTPPAFVTASFFDKDELFKNNFTLLTFFWNKIVNVVRDNNNVVNTFIYFSPLLFFLIYLGTEGFSFQTLTLFSILFILLDIFQIQQSSGFFLLAISFLWGLTLLRHRFESRISAVFALFFFIITPLCILFDAQYYAEKSAVWSYLFLCIATISQIYEIVFKPKATFSLSSFIKYFPKFEIDSSRYSNRLIKKIYVLIIFVGSLYTIIKIIEKIKYSINIFIEFYPQNYLSSGLIIYLIYITCTILFGLWIVWRNKSFFTKSKIFVLILVIVLKVLISFISSSSTTFEHQPKILDLSPITTSEAWVDVTVTGKNFQDLPFVGKVFIDGVEQGEYIIQWSDEKIVFRTSPALSKSGNLCVQTLSKGTSNCLPIEYNFNNKK